MSNNLVCVTEFRLKLYPKDFAKVRQFYEDVLGFSAFHEWNRLGSHGVMLDVGGVVLELLTPEKDHKPVQNASVSGLYPMYRS